MRKELETIEQIERYLMGEMSAAEKQKFESELSSNPELQKKVQLQEQMLQGLKRNYLKTKAKKAYKSVQLKNNFIKWGLIAAIPISAILLFTALPNNSNTDKETLRDPNVLPELNENGDTIWADADNYLPYQFFTINNEKDTVIETENGIVFAIPANAFVDENGKSVKGNYLLEVKEAITLEDILKSGLETRSGDQLLETAGMFYINGRQNNTSLNINPENGIYANIPTQKVDPEMQLFEGKRKADGGIDWINPKPLEKFLIPVDIHALNFYPPNYQDSLAAMGKDYNNKSYTDSLYYSFEAKDEKNKIYNSNKSDSAIYQSDTLKYSYNEGQYTAVYSTISSQNTYGIVPAKVKAIWDPTFNNTILATKEFEERMQAIHLTCNNDILDLYVNNLDKNLCTIDSMAANLLGEGNGPFMDFARRGDGKVKIDQSINKKLVSYFQEKEKIYAAAAKKTHEEWQQKNENLNRIAQEKNNLHQQNENKRKFNNFKEEFDLNIDEAYRQIGKKKPKTPIVFTDFYTAKFIITGWKNLDYYVAESTINRETLDYTDPETGKKAIIRYEPFSVQINQRQEYDVVFAYLIPDKLSSFMRMKEEKAVFSEKLNELIQYEFICVAYKGKEVFISDVYQIKPGDLGTINLNAASDKEFDKKIASLKSYNKERSLRADLSYQLFSIADRRRQKEIKNQVEFIRRIKSAIFPCYKLQAIPTLPLDEDEKKFYQ